MSRELLWALFFIMLALDAAAAVCGLGRHQR